jgi:hypothetical protein
MGENIDFTFWPGLSQDNPGFSKIPAAPGLALRPAFRTVRMQLKVILL